MRNRKARKCVDVCVGCQAREIPRINPQNVEVSICHDLGVFMCIIHWLQTFWVGPTLLFSRGGISLQITQVKSTRSTQCRKDTSNKIFIPLIAHAQIHIYFKDILIFLNKFELHEYVHMYMLTVVLFQRKV